MQHAACSAAPSAVTKAALSPEAQENPHLVWTYSLQVCRQPGRRDKADSQSVIAERAGSGRLPQCIQVPYSTVQAVKQQWAG